MMDISPAILLFGLFAKEKKFVRPTFPPLPERDLEEIDKEMDKLRAEDPVQVYERWMALRGCVRLEHITPNGPFEPYFKMHIKAKERDFKIDASNFEMYDNHYQQWLNWRGKKDTAKRLELEDLQKIEDTMKV